MALEASATVKAKFEGGENVKSIKAEIKAAKEEAFRLSRQFGEFSPQAIEATKKLAALKDEMEDLNNRVAGLNPDRFSAIAGAVGGIASGISAAQGAMALFGSESEDVQKALLKVQGAMALATGVQGVIDAQEKFQGLATGAVNAFKQMTGAAKAFMATGLGLLITGVALLISYWDDIKGAISGVSSEQGKLNEQTNKNLDANKKKLETIDKSQNILKAAGKTEKEIRQLKLDQLKVTIANAEVAVKNAKITKDAQVAAAKRNNDILQGVIKSITAPIQLLLKTVDMVGEAMGKTLNLQKDFNEGLANMFFDPVEVAKEGDKVIAEAENTLLELKDSQAAIILSIQKENADAAKKATDNQKKITEDRAKADAKYAEETAVTLAERLAAFEMSWALELKGEEKKNLTKEQLQREHDLRTKAISDKFQAEQKAIEDKRIADQTARAEEEFKTSLDAIEKYYDDRANIEKQRYVNGEINAKQLADNLQLIEKDKYGRLLTEAADYGKIQTDILKGSLDEQVKNKQEADEKEKLSEKEKQEAIKAARLDTLQSAGEVFAALSGLFKQGSDAQKAFALAQIGADTARALTSALANSQAPTTDNLATGGLAGIAKYIALAATIITNAARAKQILGKNTGNTPTAPSQAANVPQLFRVNNQSLRNVNAPQVGSQRVYVVESDITNAQGRVKVNRQTSVF
jgi:hypothetical protein